MKTTKVLETNISEITIDEVSNFLNTSSKKSVAICNANTLVRSAKNSHIRDVVNSFDIKTPDGFPVAKALSFLTKRKFSRVDGYKVFLTTI
jgi:UDP-N-acetyl-D-mannosaminuronic acid transferase (WecB/TagA/CpsF family)